MLCPKCNQEMLFGYIPTKAIEWIPFGGKLQLSYRGDKKKGFRIGKYPIFKYKKQPADYCFNCEIVLIDTTMDEF